MKFWRRKPTNEEKYLKQALEKLGVQVLSQVRDGHKHIDLAIPSAKINIEVDGKQHLTNPHQIISDMKRAYYSDALGYETVHIPNEYIHSDLEKIAKALSEAAIIREKQITQGLTP
jgi:very-short-patch-repair endonuclease